MEPEELLEYLTESVPNFLNPELIEHEGECFHYTENWRVIEAEGVFKGAPVNQELDQTQNVEFELVDDGVVFGYDNLEDAREEGYGCSIVKIRYRKAIRALHESENNLGDLFAEAAVGTEMEGLLDTGGAPPTLLILAADILDFELVTE